MPCPQPVHLDSISSEDACHTSVTCLSNTGKLITGSTSKHCPIKTWETIPILRVEIECAYPFHEGTSILGRVDFPLLKVAAELRSWVTVLLAPLSIQKTSSV